MCPLLVLNTRFWLYLCIVNVGTVDPIQLYNIISALLKGFGAKHSNYTVQATIQHTLSNLLFPYCFFHLLLTSSGSSLFPQAVLVPGLFRQVKTQLLASSLPLTPSLLCWKCVVTQDSRYLVAWMWLSAVAKVTGSGVGMNPTAQVGWSSTENVLARSTSGVPFAEAFAEQAINIICVPR